MRQAYFLLSVLILASCAKVVPPSGGERDTTAPQLIQAIPSNGTVNFNAESIYLVFDEYVQLNDIQNQLIVSPPLEKRPNIRLKKKGVLIELNERLKPSTTYTFNFGAGIGDFTENNPAESLIYVISTGEVLDSLQFKGDVIDAYTGLPVEGAKVMLYKEHADSLPLVQKPYYFARSDKSGAFRVSNMSEGEYKVFVLNESNANYLYDDPSSESFGFLSEFVRPSNPQDSAEANVRFRLSQERDTLQYFQDYYTDSTGFAKLVYFQKPLDPSAAFLDGAGNFVFKNRSADDDTTYMWINEAPSNQERSVVFFDEGKSLDTLQIKHFRVSGEKSEERYKLLSTSKPQGSVRKEDTLRFVFNRPIAGCEQDLIQVLKDSIPLDFNVKIQDFSLLIDAPFKDGERSEITLFPNAVESREGMLLQDTLRTSVSFMGEEELGNLSLVLPFEAGQNDIIQLVDKNGRTIDSQLIDGRGEIIYKRLKPAVYRFRIFEDKNQNGKWDAANYSLGLQPELVYNFSDDIQLRANWEMEIVWNLKK